MNSDVVPISTVTQLSIVLSKRVKETGGECLQMLPRSNITIRQLLLRLEAISLMFLFNFFYAVPRFETSIFPNAVKAMRLMQQVRCFELPPPFRLELILDLRGQLFVSGIVINAFNFFFSILAAIDSVLCKSMRRPFSPSSVTSQHFIMHSIVSHQEILSLW